MIRVLKTGFYDSIQDLGRYDYQEYGVPISGVMDTYSAVLANGLLGNDESDAVLEMTLFGPALEFQTDTCISISGADISPKLNTESITMNTLIHIKTGDVLSFGKLNYGCRTYLAVSGGFQTKQVMNSRSMYKNITIATKISKDDVLPIASFEDISIASANAIIKVDLDHFNNDVLEVYKGPEFNQLSSKQKNQLFDKQFTIAKENSRMAYQLVETLENQLHPIITSLVLPGTVQLTPSGKLIVLARDCQTTGGYPRVLQLSDKSINRLAQKFTGTSIRFKLLD